MLRENRNLRGIVMNNAVTKQHRRDGENETRKEGGKGGRQKRVKKGTSQQHTKTQAEIRNA